MNTELQEKHILSCRLGFATVFIMVFFALGCGTKVRTEKKFDSSIEDWIQRPSTPTGTADDWELVPRDLVYEITPQSLPDAISRLADVDICKLDPDEVVRYTNHNVAAVDHSNYFLVRGIWAPNCNIETYSRGKSLWVRCGCLGRRAKGFRKMPYIVLLSFHPVAVFVDTEETI